MSKGSVTAGIIGGAEWRAMGVRREDISKIIFFLIRGSLRCGEIVNGLCK
jgi:hypothetical protein